jgi:hypothetical protein
MPTLHVLGADSTVGQLLAFTWHPTTLHPGTPFMTCLRTISTTAAFVALAALPGAIAAQATTVTKSTTTISAEVDPWLAAWRKETTQTRVARSNLRALDDALEPYRMKYADLSAGERAEIRNAFGNILPGQRITTYRINTHQAQAITYLALGPVRGRREHRCEYTRQPEPVPTPAPVQAGEPAGPVPCRVVIDSLSRDAAWIHTAILSISRSGGGHRQKSAELDELRAMAERARGIVIGTPRCGCRTGDDADALLTSTREALDAVAASSVPAWMTLRGEHVERISKLSDSVERSLLRCLSSR